MDFNKNPFIRQLGQRLKVYLNNLNNPLYRKWYFKHSVRLKQFKEKHKNQDCFIIGNGPSLNSMDLNPLKHYHTFGLNKIHLMSKKVDLNLSYHVSVNRFVIEQSAYDFERLSCPSFLSYKSAYKIVRELKHIYFIFTGSPYMFHKDITQKVSEGYTVTFVAMQVAYYMGFKRVFLIGVDHNYKATGNPNEKQFLSGTDKNHFDPTYFGNKEWQLPDLEASELSYHLAKFWYQKSGREIIDATYNGNLETFPKIPYEKAYDLCVPK
jgi:hypothetical protein